MYNNNIIEQQTIKIDQAGGKSYVLASVVHKHPKFSMDNPSGDNDIAILKVKNCSRNSPNINLYKFENIHLLLNTLLYIYQSSQLSKDLTFSDKIKPACLPTSATKDYSGGFKESID